MHRPLLLFLFLFLSFHLSADHLELKKNAGIKSQPNKEAPVIYQGAEKEHALPVWTLRQPDSLL